MLSKINTYKATQSIELIFCTVTVLYKAKMVLISSTILGSRPPIIQKKS